MFSNMKKLRKEIKTDMKFFNGIDLTNDQIDAILKLVSEEDLTSMKLGFDTSEREAFMDALAKYVVGPKYHWPTYSEGEANGFFDKIEKGFKKKGIKIVSE